MKARCRELYAIKTGKLQQKQLEKQQKKLQEKKEAIQKLQDQLQAKEQELNNNETELQARNEELPEEDAIDMLSDKARRKALSRVKAVLLRRRSQNIGTTIDLIQKSTPRKAAALKKAGVGALTQLQSNLLSVE